MENIFSIFKDYQEYISETIFGLLSIICFFLVRKYYSKKLRFNYYETKRIDLTEFEKDDFQFDFASKGLKINNPKILGFKFTNLGDLPIKSSEWESPMQFIFKEALILNAYVSSKKYDNIKCDIMISDNQLHLSFGLLNQKDYLSIEILLDTLKIDYTSIGRISGVPEIENKAYTLNPFEIIRQPLQLLVKILLGCLIFCIVLGINVIIFILDERYIPRIVSSPLMIVILVDFLLIFFIYQVVDFIKEKSKRYI